MKDPGGRNVRFYSKASIDASHEAELSAYSYANCATTPWAYRYNNTIRSKCLDDNEVRWLVSNVTRMRRSREYAIESENRRLISDLETAEKLLEEAASVQDKKCAS